jgi:hypothetical protein
MDRHYWAQHIAGLDPETEYEQIYRIITTHEFPWDMNQSLSFALYRTYAVPSIGGLLRRTGEFTERTQKRYDDTALILDTVLEHGLASEPGRAAIRRMNQMHGAYPISNDEKRYVLCTFVMMPIRWIERYGWRPLSELEKTTRCWTPSATGARPAGSGRWPPGRCGSAARSSAGCRRGGSRCTPASCRTSAATPTATRWLN